MTVLFFVAVLARVLIIAVVTHWSMIGVAFLIGSSPDRVVAITKLVMFLIMSATVVGLALGRRQSGAKERMASGPVMVAKGRILVMIVGFSSDLGGLLLFVGGTTEAGGWAMALGTAMVVSELTAVGGALVAGNWARPKSVQ